MFTSRLVLCTPLFVSNEKHGRDFLFFSEVGIYTRMLFVFLKCVHYCICQLKLVTCIEKLLQVCGSWKDRWTRIKQTQLSVGSERQLNILHATWTSFLHSLLIQQICGCNFVPLKLHFMAFLTFLFHLGLLFFWGFSWKWDSDVISIVKSLE